MCGCRDRARRTTCNRDTAGRPRDRYRRAWCTPCPRSTAIPEAGSIAPPLPVPPPPEGVVRRAVARHRERRVVEGRLPRRAVEPDAVDRDRAVLEVVRATKHRAGGARLALERPVVVAGDDDLVAVRQREDPARGAPELGEVAAAAQ